MTLLLFLAGTRRYMHFLRVPELLAANRSECQQIASLERQIQELNKRVAESQRGNFIVVPVRSLGDEPYELTCEIPVVVQGTGDDYVATHFDTGVSMSGDTEQEAVDNLKVYMVDLFELLERDESKLAPGPRKQLAALRTVLQRRA